MAEDRRYVIQVVGDLAASGGGAPRGPGMGGPPVNTDGGPQQIQNPNLNLMAKHLREIAAGTTGLGGSITGAMKKTGIQFSLAGILKQSQLFTGMIGSVFQILGAAVDIILAAFMPILIPAIRVMANILPILKTVIDNSLGVVINWLAKLVGFLTGDTLKNKVDDAVTGALQTVLGDDSSIAKSTGDAAGWLAKLGAPAAIVGLLALSPIGKFLKVGGGISKIMNGVKGAVVGIGKISGLTNFFKGTKFGQMLTKAVSSGFSATKGIGKALLKGPASVVKGVGGLFGKVPGVAKLGGKVGAKGLIPGLSSAIIAMETVGATVKNFKDARAQGAGWGKSLGLAGATATAGLGAAALSLTAPMAGLAAQEGGTMLMNQLMNASVGTNRSLMEGTMTGSVINIVNNNNGVTEDTLHQRLSDAEGDNVFNNHTHDLVYPK